MKRHPAYLAAALLLFAVLACNLSKNGNNSNNSNKNSNNNNSAKSQPTRSANADVYVDQLAMAKDDDDKPGETTTTFAPSDTKIHCVIDLNKAKAGTKVRTVWIAVDVPGSRNETIKTLDYTTNSFEKKITGYLTWKGDWPKGQYRLEVYINGSLDKTIDYTIE